jgi:hypothetical protein
LGAAEATSVDCIHHEFKKPNMSSKNRKTILDGFRAGAFSQSPDPFQTEVLKAKLAVATARPGIKWANRSR